MVGEIIMLLMDNFSIYSKYIAWHLKLNDNHKLNGCIKHSNVLYALCSLFVYCHLYKCARFLNEKLCDAAYALDWLSEQL